MMKEDQDKVLHALNQSQVALTRQEISTQTGLTGKQIGEACYALSAAGKIHYRAGWYTSEVGGNT